MSHKAHLMAWVFLGIAIAVAIMFLAPRAWIADSVGREVRVTQAWLGTAVAAKGVNVANGLVSPLMHYARTELVGHASARGDAKLYRNPWHHGVGKGAWRALIYLYGIIFRGYLLVLWLLPGIILVAAAAVDGYARRTYVIETFAAASPIALDVQVHAVLACIGLPFVFLLLPLALPPIIPGLIWLGLAFMTRMAVANIPEMN